MANDATVDRWFGTAVDRVTKEGAQARDAVTIFKYRALRLTDGNAFHAERACAWARTPLHQDA